MAEQQPAPTDVPLLRGLFGSLQAAAQANADTMTVWSTLRAAAASWQFQAQGVPQPYDESALQSAGRAILSSKGINAATVSTFRGVAGSWLGARQALHALEDGQQITANAVFTAPWSQTSSSAVPSRYRIRTQWQVTSADGEASSVWRADEVTGPLTTLADALSQVEPDANTQSGQQILSGGEPPVLVDYEIEQV